MRIQKLTIHNIASIEDAVIDFEAQPLADSEVFLITGKTGAGKSTLLDAICLALYADTPRLDGTKMEGDTQDGDHSVKTNDPRQLMRKNTGEASVSLTFTGSNGIHYLATWSVARAYKKPSGKLQGKEWEWKNLDDPNATPLRKDAEIRAEIQTAIGLDFDQFCRTTLLAQGEFTRFLNSKDEEKAKILEKITGVDIYSKIGAKVFEVTSAKKQAWDNAQLLIKETHTLSEEEIQHKQEEIQTLDQEHQARKQQLDKDKQKQQWIRTEADNTKHLTDATRAHEEAVAKLESESFKADEQLVRQWNETIEARNWMTAKKEAESNMAKQKEALTRLREAYLQVLEGLAAEEQEKQAKEKELKALPEANPEEESRNATALKDLRSQLDRAKTLKQDIATVYERIDRHTAEKERREKAKKALEETLDELHKKRQERANLEPKLHDAKVRMDTCKEVLDKQSDTIDKFAISMRQKLQVGDTCPVCGQPITGELPHEAALEHLIGQLREAFKQAESAHQELVNQKNKLDAWIQTAEKNYQNNKEAFDQDRSVANAKQKVIDGCLACGIETIDENTPKALSSLKDQNETNLKELEAKIPSLEKKAETYQMQVRQRQTLELQLTTVNETCRMTREAVTELQQRMPEWEPLTATSAKAMPELLKQATKVQRETATAQGQLEWAEGAFRDNDGRLQVFLDGHEDLDMSRLVRLNTHTPQSITEIHARLDTLRNQALAAKTLKEEAARKLEAHQQAKPELSEDDTLEALTSRISASEKAMTELAEKRGALLQELKTDEQNKLRLGQLIQEAEQKHKDYLRWERMNQHIGDKTGNKFRKIAQSYVLSSLIHSANSYMRTLTDRYTLKVTPGTFVISIEDAYQGYASRAASTISGGESFLVSLSLALALSDIGQRLAVDTLFIDEGFGTLSGEPLQNAVNTLRSLHNKAGRHVGIISHVEELKESIPVQIQVNQEGNHSSSQVVIVPSDT